jgi:hypothetical protein
VLIVSCGGGQKNPKGSDASGGSGLTPGVGTGASGGNGGSGNGSGGRGGTGSNSGGTNSTSGSGGGEIPEIPGAEPCPNPEMKAESTFYVCDCQEGSSEGCVAGDDAAFGTEEAPFRTFKKATERFNTLPAGGTVALCRGGAFDEERGEQVSNTSCSAEQPCVFRDYVAPWGNEDLPAPIARFSTGNAFNLQEGGDAVADGGYLFMNLDLRAPIGTDGCGFFVYNDLDDVLICGVSTDGFRIGVYLGGSNDPEPGSDGMNSNIVVRNSSIKNSPQQGYLGSCDNCGIAYTTFDNNGFGEAVANHNIYLGSSQRVITNMFIVGNDLYRSSFIDGQCTAVSLVVHGLFDGLLIEGNTIREDVGAVDDGCWGIAVDGGYSGFEQFDNIKIRNNTVINVGNVGIGTSSCQNCLIENNVVIHEQAAGSTMIAIPNKSAEDTASDAEVNAITVRNNTLFAKSPGNMTGVRLGNQGTGHSVYNNAVYQAGSGSLTCFAYNLEASAYTTRDNNVCQSASGTLNWTRDITDLVEWQSGGIDALSKIVDPLFTSIAEPYDFIPKDGSPLIDAASEGPSDDRDGNPRGDEPDVGAYERK